MVDAQLNVFDSVVLGIFFLSCLVAFFRGFIREVLSLGAWVGAGMLTVYFFPQTTELMKHYVKNDTAAAGFGAMGTYFCALIGISILNSIIIRYVKDGAEVGMLDNILGLTFGAVRGAFVISLGFLVLTFVMKEDDYPKWIKEAQTREYAEMGAEMLSSVAPGYVKELSTMKDKFEQARQEKQDDLEDAQEGYTNENRGMLDRLMNTQQPNNAEYPKPQEQ